MKHGKLYIEQNQLATIMVNFTTEKNWCDGQYMEFLSRSLLAALVEAKYPKNLVITILDSIKDDYNEWQKNYDEQKYDRGSWENILC